ncbi:hypothetical protein CK203_089014 [Vitis vinifera]|uniref:GAG-pre-integrase domain-containing protein n=1 Tax=Vitis vinifera TaxID=29760 RepID=A0A438BQU5_VITVI|nr:hypothetical protein CK203_089014 [Vitis vinifera]
MLDLSFGPKASTLLTRGPHGPHAAIGCGPHVVDLVGPSPRQSKRTYCEHYGTLSPVAGKGSIRIAESIILNLVLHDLSSGKTISSAKEREGLYYFDEIYLLGQCPPTVCNSASYPKDSELLLWHKRMGHPSFQ